MATLNISRNSYATLQLLPDKIIYIGGRRQVCWLSAEGTRTARKQVWKPFPWYSGQTMNEEGLFKHVEHQTITVKADELILKAHAKLTRAWANVPHTRRIVMVDYHDGRGTVPVLRFERIPDGGAQ